MKDVIRTALIFHKDNIFLSGNHFDNTYYNFFIKALNRNNSLEVTNFPTKESFDTSVLKNNFDIILLWSNGEWGMPKELENIEKIDIPVVARVADPGDAKNAIKSHKKWKIDYYFSFMAKDFFYELYPKEFNYETIIFGLESSLYKNLRPFNERIKKRILDSGAIGNTKFIGRMINSIKNPKWNAFECYKLRTICSKLPYVDYTSTLDHNYVNDNYPKLLEKYAAAIAADTYTPVVKFWEMPAAGCLTFMEITKKNMGNYLGFTDGVNAIFINENNYKEKFEEYLADTNNPKWENIARAGREYALNKLNNDKAVESLLVLMRKLL